MAASKGLTVFQASYLEDYTESVDQHQDYFGSYLCNELGAS